MERDILKNSGYLLKETKVIYGFIGNQRNLKNNKLKIKISEIYCQNRGKCGSPFIHEKLEKEV